MRRFLVTVNGRAYEVEVEEVSAFPQSRAEKAAAPQTPVTERQEQPAPQKSEPAPAAGPSGAKVVAPMPGRILSVKAGPGQAVKRGDVLMILEAMKMENEIQAPVAGTITAIAVSEGVSVNAGALLACIG
jgi:biotin carboxyl carrier protein